MGEPTELYPGHAAELAAHAARIKAIEVAAREPLPGPLLRAYDNVPYTVAGFTIRPLVHYDFVLLTKLESPLVQQLRGQPGTKFSDEQAYEMVWQFSRPCRVVAAELAAYEQQRRQTHPDEDDAAVLQYVRARFRDRATSEVGMSLGIIEAALLVKAVEREIHRSFATAVKYEPRSGDDPGNFTPPPTPPKTGSVGGSTTSAGS